MTNKTNTMRAWRNYQYGKPTEVLKLDEVEIPEPGENELRLRVQAIPMNLNDLERVTGGNMFVRPELPAIPGMEVMGIVDSIGSGVSDDWQDKRVVAIPSGAHGGYAEYVICPTASAYEMPESVPLPGAAALYFPFHLAWLGLCERAKVKAGETVLINGAAGSVGTAAIQLAVNAGARVIAMAGSDEKLALCKKLGAEVTINHNEEDFVAIVREQTNGRGVDIVFDNVGESVMEQNLGLIVYDGRYVMMGFASNKLVADEKFLVPRRLACSNISLCCVMLFYADEAQAAMAKEHMGWNFAPSAVGQAINDKVIELVESEKVFPVVGRVVKFEEIPAELEAIANQETLGRTIVKLF
jgi:NADPH2:quinone reductase